MILQTSKDIDKRISKYFDKRPISEYILLIATSVFVVSVFNIHALTEVSNILSISTVNDYAFLASIYISFCLWILLFLCLLSLLTPSKTLSIIIIIFSAIIAYMQSEYSVIYDETMIRNLAETDVREATELLSFKWLAYIFIAGVIPAYIISKIHIRKQTFIKSLAKRVSLLLMVIILTLGNIYVFSDNYASLLRNNRHIRDTIIPSGFIYSSYKYVKSSFPRINKKITPLGRDATVNLTNEFSDKPTVLVIVVGETVRAANFGVGGYKRDTTPNLKRRINKDPGAVYFKQFFSCGTATAISLPCMFSAKNRGQFNVDAAKYEENLLDVFKHAGLDVVWVDNNSGCKGVCARINHRDTQSSDNNYCNKSNCFDMALVSNLGTLLKLTNKDLVIVLHQQGSHGPAYFERAPLGFHKFQPTCHSSHLPDCTKAEIINSYDNTILYTDYVLEKMIETLEKASDKYATAMFYVSDHGESLGEYNLYLHGMPYAIAPEEQKHVPAFMWVSQHFNKKYELNMSEVKLKSNQSLSHDNLFHSFLGLLNIQTQAYQPNLDIFHDTKNH